MTLARFQSRTLSFITNLCREKQVSAAHLLVVDVLRQEMHLFQNMQFVKTYRISTGEKGIGQVENSGKTPLGLHTVVEKIGEGEDPFTIFKSRKPQEESFNENNESRQIVGRILWLKGKEEGFNSGRNVQGEVVDSYERYIYIHGTNQVNKIGSASSAGCVCLLPQDMVELYDLVELGASVYIAREFTLEVER